MRIVTLSHQERGGVVGGVLVKLETILPYINREVVSYQFLVFPPTPTNCGQRNTDEGIVH